MTDSAPIAKPEARSPGATSASSRAGQFLFLGAITPHDPASGRLVTTLAQVAPEARRATLGRILLDVPVERALAQTWSLYSTLAQTLAEHGTSLENLLRQRLFLADLRDLAAVERVMDMFLPGAKPATTIVEVPRAGVDPRITVQLDAIALVPEPGGVAKETVHVPDLEAVAGRYPPATRAGQFVFVSNVVGINLETGKLAMSLAELGAEARRFADYPFRTAREEAILAQSWFTFQNIGRVLESQGASLGDILKVNGWLGFVMKEFGPLNAVREVLFAAREGMPASASIGISALARDGAHLGYECIALVPPKGDGYRKQIHLGVAELSPIYVGVLRGGPFVFTCGEVPIDVKTPRVITSFDDLDDAGRFLPAGRIHTESGIQARAWFVYNRHRSYLEAHGASFKDVVHQTVYLCNPADYPALERVATLFFGTLVPPTTLVPITDTSPYPEAEIEIEMIAAT